MKCTPCQANRIRKLIAELRTLKAVQYFEDDEGELYVKTFLIDDTRNKNGWRVTWDSIKRKAKSFVGRPGIEYVACGKRGCQRDHTNENSFDDNIHKQEKYRVSTITKVELDEDTHTAYAWHHIENKDFAGKIKRHEVKFLSPSVWPNKEKTRIYNAPETDDEWYIDTTDWKGVHDAWVDNPAYGHKATILEKCQGTQCVKKYGNVPPLTASQVFRIKNIIKALIGSEEVEFNGKKGHWVTSKGQAIFIPSDVKDKGEFIRNYFEKKRNDGGGGGGDAKPKKSVPKKTQERIDKAVSAIGDSKESGVFVYAGMLQGENLKEYVKDNKKFVTDNFEKDKWKNYILKKDAPQSDEIKPLNIERGSTKAGTLPEKKPNVDDKKLKMEKAVKDTASLAIDYVLKQEKIKSWITANDASITGVTLKLMEEVRHDKDISADLEREIYTRLNKDDIEAIKKETSSAQPPLSDRIKTISTNAPDTKSFGEHGVSYENGSLHGDTYNLYQNNKDWIRDNFTWNAGAKTWTAKDPEAVREYFSKLTIPKSEKPKRSGPPATEKQKGALRNMAYRLERIDMFDSFSGTGRGEAARIFRMLERDDLSAGEASDAISNAITLIEDEM